MERLFKSLAIIGLSVLALNIAAHAQPLSATRCPTITVDCPVKPAQRGGTQVVTTNVADGPPDMKLTYQWSVTGGTIKDGQGTASIIVAYPEDIECWSSTATVKISGLDSSCRNTFSCSLEIDMGHPPFQKLDEYGPISPEAEHERLDNFAMQLEDAPGAVGYVVFYPERGAAARQWRSRAVRARRYLIREKRIDPKRLFINSGQLDWQAIELWLVWPGPRSRPSYKIISPPPNFRVEYPKCI